MSGDWKGASGPMNQPKICEKKIAPKIIDTVAQALELQSDQTTACRKVLFERGNMSSATLPHIWEEIFKNPPASGTPVVSLAFGPGLTVFGGLFEYRA